GGGTAKSGGHGADGDYYVGLSGAAGVGGAGAWYYFGGGGGGGYFGGGGGSMGGGGGGSSYTDPMTTSAVQHTAGYNKNGNGRLVITLYYTRDNNGVGASKNKHIITPDTTM
ncbi:MAG: hypothetical protein JWQ38_2232, partial [Flavipsychrobacter sp.]|nr:hypothetical protein [Flavipsychrobacter sp.]